MSTEPAAELPPSQPETSQKEAPPLAARLKPVGWPKWLGAVDLAMAILAVLVAFLVASFTARNTDFWRHIGTGRLLVQGKYLPGTDPLTYTGADRPWVNPNWLAEVAFYGFYSLDTTGAAIVALKAMLFATAFALLLVLRKPDASLWPWAFALAAGAIGAGLFAQLRPYVFGLLFESILIGLLFKGNSTKGSELRMPLIVGGIVALKGSELRTPLIVGGIVALWANCDSLVFLGPLTIGLFALGEFLHAKLFAGRAELPDDEDPFPKLPAVPVLVKAFLVSCAALLLNPSFLVAVAKNPTEAISQLVPMELDPGTAAPMLEDRDLRRVTFAVLNREYLTNPLYGQNLSTYVAIGLIVAGAAALGFGYRFLRVSHVLFWLAIVLLALLVHARFLGHAMLACVPFVAIAINGLFRPLTTMPTTERTASLLIQFSRLGRILGVLVLAACVVAALPGWFQPPISVVGFKRYVAWSVDDDYGGHKRGALLLQALRTEEATASTMADVRGLLTHPEFGDFCAWFAPAEKPMLNSRHQFHRKEWPDLVRIRKLLTVPAEPGTKPKPPGQQELKEIAESYGAGYLAVSAFNSQALGRFALLQAVLGFQAIVGEDTVRVGEFLYLDGRFALVGRVDGAMLAKSEELAWKPAAKVFGRGKPGDDISGPREVIAGRPPLEGWKYELLMLRTAPSPFEAVDAVSYAQIASTSDEDADRVFRGYQQFLGRNGLGVMSILGPMAVPSFDPGVASTMQSMQYHRSDNDFALPLLALQSARAAIARNPDDPGGYQALADAYKLSLQPDLGFGTSDSEFMRKMQVLTALNRVKTRLPASDELADSKQLIEGLLVRHELVLQYAKAGYYDAMRDQLIDLIKVRLSAGEKGTAYDPKVIELWQTLIYRPLIENVEANIRRQQPKMLQRFQQNPFEFLIEFKALKEDDHPQSIFPKPPKAPGEEDAGPTEDTTLQAERQLKRLEELLRNQEIQISDGIQRQLAGQNPAQRFRSYAGSPLVLRAKKLYEDMPNRTDDVSLSLEYTLLMYRLGLLEEVHSSLKLTPQDLLGSDPTKQLAPQLQPLVRGVLLYQALLLGDDYQADQHAVAFMQSSFVPLTPQDKAIASSEPRTLVQGVGIVAGGLPMNEVVTTRMQLTDRLMQEAHFTFRRGVLALLRGNAAEAKRLFDLAEKPQGVPLHEVSPVIPIPDLAVLLPKYRELLAKYAK